MAGTRFESTDYFRGTAFLYYDPSVCDPSAIAHFVSRATSFGVKVVYDGETNSEYDPEMSTTLRFRVPNSTVDLLSSAKSPLRLQTISRSKKTAVLQVTFKSKGQDALLARDVQATVTAKGGGLLPIAESKESTKQASTDFCNLVCRLLVSIILCIPTLVLVWAPSRGPSLARRLAALILATGIVANASPILSASMRSIIFLRQVDLLVLVSISVLVSWAYSFCAFVVQEAGYHDIPAPFFETVALLVTLVYLGRVVQASARLRVATKVSKLVSESAGFVRIVHEPADRGEEIDARLLHYSDIMLLEPGVIAATDGVVVGTNGGLVDESALTGENMPVFKRVGSQVHAGSRVVENTLLVQVTKLTHENSMVRMMEAISKAFTTRSKFLDLSDRLAAILLPTAIVAASVAFLTWSLVQYFVRNANSAEAATKGLGYAIAILVVSCPCALGLSVPLITSSSILVGAREGILFRSAEGLTKAASIKVVAFDKTGTLSTGSFKVIRTFLPKHKNAEVLAFAMSKASDHPIAKSVNSFLLEKAGLHDTPFVHLEAIQAIPGKGLSSTWKGMQLLAGSATFTSSGDIAEIQTMQNEGLSIFTVTLGRRLIVAYGLQDCPKEDSSQLVQDLHAAGKVVMLISGDTTESVSHFAKLVGIDSQHVHARCLPEDKAIIIQKARKDHGVTAFVGDGTNDSVAFATADVSVAVVSATDVARLTADVLLIKGGIGEGVAKALRIARVGQVFNILGISWCVTYALVAILLAAGVTVRFSIEPRWAGLGEVVSILPIITLGACVPLYQAAGAKR
jgi:Cu2+-exporting ATPase